MNKDEASTLDILLPLLDEATKLYRGAGAKVIKTIGDCLMVEMTNARHAISTSLKVLEALGEKQRRLAATEKFPFRIGLASGPVTNWGDDRLGATVNLAARLQPHAEENCIAILDREYQSARAGNIAMQEIAVVFPNLKGFGASRVHVVTSGALAEKFASQELGGWQDRLNGFFRGRVSILLDYCASPDLRETGEFPEPTELSEAIRTLEQEISKDSKRSNEPHAFLDGEPADLILGRLTLPYRSASYAQLCALRERHRTAPACDYVDVVGGSALVCCADLDLVFVHRRTGVDFGRNRLNTIGGQFWPAPHGHQAGDYDLDETVLREVYEEMRLRLPSLECGRRMLVRELGYPEHANNWIQYVCLGVNISREVAEAWLQRPNTQQESPEGYFEQMTLEDLGRSILAREAAWLPSGLLHVLAWLALGAPTPIGHAQFDSDTARGIFREWSDSHAKTTITDEQFAGLANPH